MHERMVENKALHENSEKVKVLEHCNANYALNDEEKVAKVELHVELLRIAQKTTTIVEDVVVLEKIQLEANDMVEMETEMVINDVEIVEKITCKEQLEEEMT